MTNRWYDIRNTWLKLALSMTHIDWVILQKIFQDRYEKQSLPETHVAWCLDPRTRGTKEIHNVDNVVAFLQQHANSKTLEESAEVETQFYCFRRGEGIYNTSLFGGHLIHKPRDYWYRISIDSPGCKLASIAMRLFSCLANSVPSERAFSTQNYIHSKIRNRLAQEKVDKLSFVYFNSRALKSHAGMPVDTKIEESNSD